MSLLHHCRELLTHFSLQQCHFSYTFWSMRSMSSGTPIEFWLWLWLGLSKTLILFLLSQSEMHLLVFFDLEVCDSVSIRYQVNTSNVSPIPIPAWQSSPVLLPPFSRDGSGRDGCGRSASGERPGSDRWRVVSFYLASRNERCLFWCGTVAINK